MTYLSPGVYVEEVESGSRPIEGIGTSIAAFVGLAPGGPLDSPALRVVAGVGFLALVVLIVRHRRVSWRSAPAQEAAVDAAERLTCGIARLAADADVGVVSATIGSVV
jgi:phage tail sheath protein FI